MSKKVNVSSRNDIGYLCSRKRNIESSYDKTKFHKIYYPIDLKLCVYHNFNRVCIVRFGYSLVNVILNPRFSVEWSVWNSSLKTWPLLVNDGGTWFPEKVPRTGDSGDPPSLTAKKSN